MMADDMGGSMMPSDGLNMPFNMMPGMMPPGMSPGMMPGMPPGMPPGMMQGMPQGMPPGMMQGMPQGMPPGMMQGMQNMMPSMGQNFGNPLGVPMMGNMGNMSGGGDKNVCEFEFVKENKKKLSKKDPFFFH